MASADFRPDHREHLKRSLSKVLQHHRLLERGIFDSESHNWHGMTHRGHVSNLFGHILGFSDHCEDILDRITFPSGLLISGSDLERYIRDCRFSLKSLGISHIPFSECDIIVHGKTAMLRWKFSTKRSDCCGILRSVFIKERDGKLVFEAESSVDMKNEYADILADEGTNSTDRRQKQCFRSLTSDTDDTPFQDSDRPTGRKRRHNRTSNQNHDNVESDSNDNSCGSAMSGMWSLESRLDAYFSDLDSIKTSLSTFGNSDVSKSNQSQDRLVGFRNFEQVHTTADV